MSDAILMGQSGMNIHGDKFTGNGKGISITAKNGDFVTTGSGELKTGSFGETSQMLLSNGSACWLSKEYGLYCNHDENPIIKPFRRSSSDPLAIEWMDTPSLTVTSLEYYQPYHVPCLARLNDTMAILFYESCAEWGKRGSGLSIHVIKYDGLTITKVSEQYVADFISHGLEAYPAVQVVNDGNDYKVLFVAGWPEKDLSDSSYIDGIGMIIFKITSNGNISILGQQSSTNHGDTLSKNIFYDSVNQNFWVYYSYYSYCISLTNYTLTSKQLNSQTDNSITSGQSLIYKNYLISYYGNSLYAHNWSREGVAETRIANLTLGEYSGYVSLAFFSKENSFYIFLSNKSESKIVLIEFDFNGSAFIKKNENVICDFDISYGNYGTGRTLYNPVLNFEDEFLLDGTGLSSSNSVFQCALILTTKYNFIKSTKSALGIKKNSNTILLIPGLS